jgi:hypothetical protein
MKHIMVALTFGTSLALAAPPAEADSQRAVAFAAIATAQAKAGDLKGARETAALFLDAAVIADADDFEEAFSRAVVAGVQARTGDAESAWETATNFSGDGQERAIPLIILALVQAEAGDLKEAQATAALALQAAEGARDHHGAIWTGAVYAQARAGDIPGAFSSARTIPEDDTRADALALVAAAQAEAGDAADAMATAQRIDVPATRADALFLIALAQAESGEAGAAVDTATNLPIVERPGRATIVFAYARLLSSAAANAFDIGAHPEVRPAIALHAATIAQAKAGDAAAAEKTASLIIAKAAPIEDIHLRETVLAWAAGARAATGDAAALRLAESISDAEVRAMGFARAARARALVGDAVGAARLADLAFDIAMRESDSPGALTAAVMAEAAAGRVAIVLDLAQRLSVQHRFEALWRHLAVAQAKAGDGAAAVATARLIAGAETRSSALVEIARQQAALGDPAAREAAALVAESAASIVNEYARSRTLADTAAALAGSGDAASATRTLASALNVAMALADPSLRARALVRTAAAQAKAGDAAGTAESVAAARAAVASESAPYYRALALIELAEAQLAFDDLAGAKATAALAAAAARELAPAE